MAAEVRGEPELATARLWRLKTGCSWCATVMKIAGSAPKQVLKEPKRAFIAALMESGVEFVAVDNPHANKLTVHILAAVAEHERELISERTKVALQAAKARGVRLGIRTG
jgi:Resolvase, N terminal domain